MIKSKFHGRETQFYVGVVEENDDSSAKDGHKLGRCRVRLLGIHSEKKVENDAEGEGIPVDKLFWAYPIVPPIYSSMNGIGVSPNSRIMKGTWVICISFDGLASHEIFIMGTLAGVPQERLSASDRGFCDPDGVYPKDDFLGEEDTNRLARGEKVELTCVQKKEESRDLGIKVAYGGTWDQPEPYYNATYPYNLVFESECGHISEIDDTPGQERLHEYHKSGSFTEIDSSGNKTVKVVGEEYEIVVKDKKVHIKGQCNITIDGDANLKIEGDSYTEVSGDHNMRVHSNVDWEVFGDMDINVDNHIRINGKRIDLNK